MIAHFPGAVLNEHGKFCWCGQPRCMKCWYAEWHLCGDVLLERARGPLRLTPLDVEASPRGIDTRWAFDDDAIATRDIREYWRKQWQKRKERMRKKAA